MLRYQIALAVILISCVSFVSCDRAQQVLEPAAEDMMDAGDDMEMSMDMPMDMIDYMSWAHVMLPAPTVSVADAASPAETGAAHNPGSDVFTPRTVYINDIGAMANKAGTAYPAGTMIFKEIMDETNMFVDKVAMMMKSDDPMYADHNGWMYAKYARSSENAEYMQVRGSNLEDAGNGCHGCHAQADNDSVFVSLPMDMMDDDDMMDETPMDMMDDDDMMDETPMDMMDDDDMMDETMGDGIMDEGMIDDDGMGDDAGAGDAQ